MISEMFCNARFSVTQFSEKIVEIGTFFWNVPKTVIFL